MQILENKKILITGVLTESSLAFEIAKQAQSEGAEIILTGAGRGLSLTKRSAKKLNKEPKVLELDVTQPEQLNSAATELGQIWDRLDGIVHSIGFAPSDCLGGDILKANWNDVSTALEISAYSLKALAQYFLPLLRTSESASIVGLDFDATVAWPGYDWMGVAKAALESLTRYLARDLAQYRTRVNLIAAGPIRTTAARSIPGFKNFESVWDQRAPLGWDVKNSVPVAKATIALLSDLFPATTGEIVHVDGGYHAVGA